MAFCRIVFDYDILIRLYIPLIINGNLTIATMANVRTVIFDFIQIFSFSNIMILTVFQAGNVQSLRDIFGL